MTNGHRNVADDMLDFYTLLLLPPTMRTFAQEPKATQQARSAKPRIHGRAHFGEHPEVNPILHWQRTIGNQMVQRILQTETEALEVGPTDTASPGFAHAFSAIPLHPAKSRNIQAKLMVSSRGDIYEREADDVSERVIRMPEPQPQRACPCSGGCPQRRRQQRTHGGVRLQARHTRSDDWGQTVVPAIVREVLRSSGQPLDPAIRHFMEPRFGYDFSNVRVHPERKAAESSDSVRAKAYTVGQNIVFGHGQYAPQTAEGQRLLAHELTHVIQQGSAGPQVDPLRHMPVGAPGSVDEHCADAVDAGKESRRSGLPTTRTAVKPGVIGLMLQRQVDDPRELRTETINTPHQFRISQWLDEPLCTSELYWVDFEVDAKGVMTASVRTVLSDHTYRSGLLRFGDSFRDALQHFQANGIEVNAFEGDWSYMNENEISDNLRVFREEMGRGGTREGAALKTPTAKVATRSGFELTNVENVPESQPHLAEKGVRRWRVKAIFRRSPIPKKGHGSPIRGIKAKSFAPVKPPAETVSGEFTSGGRVVGAKGGSQLEAESFAPVKPPARAVSGEIAESTVPPAPKGGSPLGGSTLIRGANAVAGVLGPVSMAAEYYNTGSIDFGGIAEQTIDVHGETHTEVSTLRISDKGFEEVTSTLISEPLPRDIKTLTPAEAERTLKEGEYFIRKSPFSTMPPSYKEFWEHPDELWRMINHRAEPTGCKGYRGDFRCPPIEALPIQA